MDVTIIELSSSSLRINEDFNKSDHRPILVDTEAQDGLNLNRAVGPKKFEAKWLCEESVEAIIQTAWDRVHTSGTQNFAEKTAYVHTALHDWDIEVLKAGGPRHRLRELQKELNEVMTGPLSDEAVDRQKEIQIKIDALLDQE
jgi:hypothetical protein